MSYHADKPREMRRTDAGDDNNVHSIIGQEVKISLLSTSVLTNGVIQRTI